MSDEKTPRDMQANYWFPAGIAIGIALGTGIGVALHNVGAGIGIGITFGIAIGLAGGRRRSGTGRRRDLDG